VPTNDDFPIEYLAGPPRDPRTGAPLHEDPAPLTDEDRRLRRVRERERWVDAISVPPPPARPRDDR
jgi:hypothetical protein